MSDLPIHTDASGTFGPQPGDTEPWLNTVDVVDDIVTAFVAETLRRQGVDAEAAASGPDRPLMKWLVPECDHLNALFLGVIHDGYRTAPWNSPEQLGHSITVNLGLTDAYQRTAVRDAFMLLAAQAVDVLNKNIEQPPEKWGWMLEGLIERMRNALLGLPADLGAVDDES